MTIHRIRRTVASRLNTMYDRAAVCSILGHSEKVDAEYYDCSTQKLSDLQKTINVLFI